MKNKQESKIYVTSMFKRSGQVVQESSKEKTVAVNVFETVPAKISYHASTTINMGNFESLKIDVGLELPCYMEEVENGFEAAKNFVNRRISTVQMMIKQGKPFGFNDIELNVCGENK